MSVAIDLDDLINDCVAAVNDAHPHAAVKEVLERAVSRPSALEAALPAPVQQMTILHVSDELTMFQLVNGPRFAFCAHDHAAWSAVALYTGQEENLFYRRTPAGLQPTNGKVHSAGEVLLMGSETIHSIANPLSSCNAAIHVFGGNPWKLERRQWDPETLVQGAFDVDEARRLYPLADRR